MCVRVCVNVCVSVCVCVMLFNETFEQRLHKKMRGVKMLLVVGVELKKKDFNLVWKSTRGEKREKSIF